MILTTLPEEFMQLPFIALVPSRDVLSIHIYRWCQYATDSVGVFFTKGLMLNFNIVKVCVLDVCIIINSYYNNIFSSTKYIVCDVLHK